MCCANLREGWMEMPELYGSPYILPAVIVVVLLLVVLLILVKRKGRVAAPAATRSVATPARPPASPVTGPKKPATGPSIASATAPATAGVATAAVTTGAGLRRDTAPLDDPLRTVIMGILQGWGDLTGDDTKRLEVFRPEKILEEAGKVVLPKDHKAGERARVRLNGIRQYAAGLQLKAQPADADIVLTADADTGLTAEAAAGRAAEALIDAPPSEPTETTATAETVEPAEEMDGTIAAPAVTEISESSVWTDELEKWEIGEPPPREEMPAWPASLYEEEPDREVPSEEPLEAETLTARAGTPEDSLSSLHMKMKTADDLLALPADQRVDMLAFLEPAQLSRVFEAADDLDLKMGVIDTLEHVGNPSALDVLRRCLDDPSPEIQLRALEAADRLLGVD
jgi:hypothetical protein